jgi:exopolysaccharide production protein ExoQ
MLSSFPKRANNSITSLSRIAFFLYLFFVFFGTSMPFQEKITDPNDITLSNPVNQFVYPTIYLLSLPGLYAKRKKLLLLITNEKYLTLFLFWCLLTISWSDFPVVSIKRWIQVLGTAIVSSSFLLHVDSADKALRYFKAVLTIYIPLCLLAILLIPGAIQWEFQAWRGLASHKNSLGQISLVSSIIWFAAFRSSSHIGRICSAILLLISLVLLIGSRSALSIFAFMLIASLGALGFIDSHLSTLRIGRAFSILVLTTFISSFLSSIYLEPDFINSILNALGKDFTFTGRTDLWAEIFKEANRHLFVGCGFEGFWVVGNDSFMSLYADFFWLPNQAHQGYLDLLNETGLIGLVLLILMLIFYFKNLSNLGKPHLWKWFVVVALIVNFQESTLFRINTLTGVLFTFSYLALYVERINQVGQAGLARRVKPACPKVLTSTISVPS